MGAAIAAGANHGGRVSGPASAPPGYKRRGLATETANYLDTLGRHPIDHSHARRPLLSLHSGARACTCGAATAGLPRYVGRT